MADVPPPTDELAARFLRAVGEGRIDQVRSMLSDAPELVNAVGAHPFWGGRPQALHVAIESKRRDLFDLLLERGADVNGTNDRYDHWSPLMLAMNGDQREMRDELLRRGARVGLVEALMMGDDARVEELLGPGTLPDIAPNTGSILAFARTPFAIDRLIALGAPTDVKDRWGSTPIDAMSRLGTRGQSLVRHMVARGIAARPEEYARLGEIDDDRAALRIRSRDCQARCRDDGRGGLQASRAGLVAPRTRRQRECAGRTGLASHGAPLRGVEWRSEDGHAARRRPAPTAPLEMRNTTGHRSGGRKRPSKSPTTQSARKLSHTSRVAQAFRARNKTGAATGRLPVQSRASVLIRRRAPRRIRDSVAAGRGWHGGSV